MKFIGVVIGTVLLVACSARAQDIQERQPSFPWPGSPVFAYALPPSNVFAPLPAQPAALPIPAAQPAPAPAPQGPQGVLPDYYWDVYAGYNFSRFYALPNATVNTNGLDGSIAYYFHSGWLGAEGEVDATFGSLGGKSSSLVFGGGGPRARWSSRGRATVWIHALAGGAHFAPLTPYGTQGAFAYEAGGGIDIDSHHNRLAYRIEGDLVGTTFFGTQQYSPKVSAGIVCKF